MIVQLNHPIEERAEKAENLSFCNGLKLLNVKQTISEMLRIIGKNEIFEQYTVHDISHIDEMLNIAEWLIPENTKGKMTRAEWLMLTLSIYFHDLGTAIQPPATIAATIAFVPATVALIAAAIALGAVFKNLAVAIAAFFINRAVLAVLRHEERTCLVL